MVRILALLVSLCFGLAAQSVNINVPAINSKGSQVSVGQAFISWHSFLDNSGKLVQGSQKTIPVTNGMISTSLVPSDNAGYVYNVLLMSGGEPSNLTWRVPAGAAVTQLSQLVQPPAPPATGYDPAGAAAAAVAAIPNASATTSGLLSKSDWVAFNAKQTPLGFMPANPANNLSEYAANAATVRSNLGLGSASTRPATDFDAAGAATAAINAIPGASSTTNGLLSKADWAAFNSKQAGLGFTPVNPANNLSEYASNAATVRANLGLGSASTHPVSDFDSAGAATAAQAAAIAASDPAGAATTAQANAIATSVQKSAFNPSQLLGVTSSGAPFVDLSLILSYPPGSRRFAMRAPKSSTWRLLAIRSRRVSEPSAVAASSTIPGLSSLRFICIRYSAMADRESSRFTTASGHGLRQEPGQKAVRTLDRCRVA